jgi:uncharacterized protein (TIGR02147 family)
MTDAQGRIRELMALEFEHHQSRNPRFSLRAYAKRLGLSPSQASDLLAGKRPFTGKLASRVLGLLDRVDHAEANILVASCLPARRGRKSAGKAAVSTLRGYQQLSVDQFRLMGDWRSFAVLSLAETAAFREDATWAGKALGIHPQQAQEILDRLERLGALQRDKTGALKHAGLQFASTTDVPSLAIRRAHRERLDLAKESLERDPVEERDVTGITMSIDAAKLPEAKRRIQKFRRELCAFLESGEKQRVFHLAVQLFPMSRKENES